MTDRRVTLTIKEILQMVGVVATVAAGYAHMMDRLDDAEHRVGDLQSQVGELSAKVDRE